MVEVVIAAPSRKAIDQDRRFVSSVCSVAKKLSATALSKTSPTQPLEPRRPAA